MSIPDEVGESVADLLASAGVRASITSIAAAKIGGNNRIFRVDTTSGTYAAKQYFRHEGDARDRLAAEFAFLTYASVAAPGLVPRPYARNPDSGFALYEFVEGRGFDAGSIGLPEVDAAIAFFRALNAPQARPAAAVLPQASEASFSVSGHLEHIDRRVGQLQAISPGSEIDRAGSALIRSLAARWRHLAQAVRESATALGWDASRPLPPGQQCVSPSDFGFHNALRTGEGRIRFLDFEYAGWDDPAKTAGDFFAQLAVPVPGDYFEHFVSSIMQSFPDAEGLATRARLLRPVYQVKWCCIALNVFLPVHLARRRFANPALDEAALKQAQLAKAEAILQSLLDPSHGLH
jgi:hypothetical protein